MCTVDVSTDQFTCITKPGFRSLNHLKPLRSRLNDSFNEPLILSALAICGGCEFKHSSWWLHPRPGVMWEGLPANWGCSWVFLKFLPLFCWLPSYTWLDMWSLVWASYWQTGTWQVLYKVACTFISMYDILSKTVDVNQHMSHIKKLFSMRYNMWYQENRSWSLFSSCVHEDDKSEVIKLDHIYSVEDKKHTCSVNSWQSVIIFLFTIPTQKCSEQGGA